MRMPSKSERPKSPRDPDLISLKEDYEMRYWTQALGVTKSELMEAVHAVGHSASRVRAYLTSHR
jgi:hypothetical protein